MNWNVNYGGQSPQASQAIMQQSYGRSSPRDQLAQILARSGSQMQPTNITGALDKVAQMGLSGYLMGDAQQKQDERQKAYQDTMTQAAGAMTSRPAMTDAPGPVPSPGDSGYAAIPAFDNAPKAGGFSLDAKNPDMAKLISILAGNPDTAGMGMQMSLSDIADKARVARENATRVEDRTWKKEDQETNFVNQMTLADMQAEKQREMARMQAGLNASNQQPHLVPVQQADGTVVYQDSRKAVGMPYFDPKTAGNRPITPSDRKQIGEALGVPVSGVDPMAGLPPRVAEAASKEQAKQTEKELADLREAVQTGRASNSDLARFQQLSKQYETGGVINNIVPNRVLGMFSPAAGEMSSIADKITPSMRQPGSGATSDFDAKMFQSATVGLGKDPQANANIVQAAQASQKLQEDLLSFKEAYATANGGSLRGADAAWKSYLDANPIFDPSSPSAPKINPRRKTYQEFFVGRNSNPQPGPASGGGIPDAAAQHLRDNPALAAEFDAKYGNGASAKILGGR